MDSLIKRPIKGDMGILVGNIFVPAETIETSRIPLVEIDIPAGSSYSQYYAAVQSNLPGDGDLKGRIYVIHFAEGDFDYGTNKLFGEEDAPNSAISDLKYYNGTILFRGEGLAKTRIFTQNSYPILLDNNQEPGRAPVAIGLIDLYLIHQNKETAGNQASVLVWNRTGGPVFLLRTMLVTTPMLDQSKGYQRAVGVDGYVSLGDPATDAAIGLVALESAMRGFNRETLRLGSYALNYIECCYIVDGNYVLTGLTRTYLWIRGGEVTTSTWQLTYYKVYWLSLLPVISAAVCCCFDAPEGNSLEDGLVLRASLRQESTTADTGQTMTLLTDNDGVLPSYEWYKGTIAINTKLKSCFVIGAEDVNVPLASEWTISAWTVSNRSNVTMANIAGFVFENNDTAGAGAAIYSPAARTTWVSNDTGSLTQLEIYTATDRDVISTRSMPPENCNCDKDWHMVCVRYYKNILELYIDGRLMSGNAADLKNETFQFMIGCRSGAAETDPVDEYISDVRLYNRALSIPEINQLCLTRAQDPEPEPDLDAGLVLHAPLASEDEIIATGQTYTETGTVTYTTDAHVPCAVFNGSSWYNVAWNAITGSSVRTMAAWIKYTGSVQNDWREATMWGEQNNNQNFGLSVSDKNYLTGGIYGNDVISTVVNDNEWHHLLFQYDGTTASLYIDGEQNAQKELSLNTQSSNLFIGYGGTTAGKIWTGHIADVRIYNRLLRSSEIEALAAFYTPYYDPDLTRDLLFHMSMTARASTAETGQSLYYYSSSNPVEESYSGIPGLSWKKSGYNYIETSLSPIFKFSICWWQVPDSTQSDKSIWSLYNSRGFLWCLQGVSLYNGSQHLHFSEGGAPDDELHFCCIVYNGVVYTLYVDGMSHGTLSQDLRFSTTQNITLRIGNRSNTSGQYYYGWASHFRLYSRVLTEEEITMLASECTPDSGS